MSNRKYSKYPQLAHNIRTLRKARSLNQDSLAKELHISKQAVSSWESGISDPRNNVLDRICDYFGVSRDQMCYDKIDYSITTDDGEPVLVTHIDEETDKTDNQGNRPNYYAQMIGNRSMIDSAVLGVLCRVLPAKKYFKSMPEQPRHTVDFVFDVNDNLIREWWIDWCMNKPNYPLRNMSEQLLGHALMLGIPEDVQYSIILFDQALYDSFLQFKGNPLDLHFEFSVILIDPERWEVNDQIFISRHDAHFTSGDETGLSL